MDFFDDIVVFLHLKEKTSESYTEHDCQAEYIVALRDSLTALGACKIGSYDHVISWQETKGCWRPL